jgi:polysaccharide biosynthesis/export protein
MLALLLVAALQAAPGVSDESSLYVVGAGDVVEITVFGQPQLSTRYPVEADGTFTFPLLGRLEVAGNTVPAIEEDLRGRLAAGYLRDPRVSVVIAEHRSQQVFVTGEVRSPGGVSLTGTMTLMEALARVGSTTDRAGFEAVIVRPRPGASLPDLPDPEFAESSAAAEVIRVDLERLRNGALSQNVTLRGGDLVFVPGAGTVFVSGQVRSAGEYPVRPKTTVRQVLALAGGVTDRGSDRRLQIIREVDGVERTINASLQDLVEAGDMIVVRERLF